MIHRADLTVRRRHICTRHSARHKVERATQGWFIWGGSPWPPFSVRGEFVLRAALIATWSSAITSRSSRLPVCARVYEWETINCIHSVRSAPRTTNRSYFDHYLSEIGMLCSRLHVSAPGYCYLIVAFDCRSCILQGENQRFGSQNTVREKSLGSHAERMGDMCISFSPLGRFAKIGKSSVSSR